TWSEENCAIHDVPPGYTPTLEEGIGYFLPEYRATVRRHVEACVQHDTPYEFVLPKLTAKGRRIWVRSMGEAVCDAGCHIVRIQGAFQDITEQKAAEAHTQALQARLEQAQLRLLETAVARLNDMVVIMEAKPSDASGRRMVFVNDAFERQTGYSRQDAIGRTPELLWGPATDRTELQRILAAMRELQAVRAEMLIRTKAGQALWVEADITPLANASGCCTCWVAVARDITERRQQRQRVLRLNDELEERVRLRTQQLARANKELESFAYSVSHDLRSPLSTIHGFSQLLAKIDAESLSDKGKHYLRRIGAGVLQMGELIEGLLTLAQLSREKLKTETVDLSALARRIAQHHCECEPQRLAKVHVQEALRAHGDSRLLLSVLQNLLGNAWKFTAKTPLARIEVGTVTSAGGELAFFVRDNGAGFDAAFAHKLFGTFERLHSPGDFAGTGIGLATVKRVVERHGGRVWAQGSVNEGATFYFTLSPQLDVAA
ncbi:MAG: PAS domain S-box protein, partial [Polaromonas sp.]